MYFNKLYPAEDPYQIPAMAQNPGSGLPPPSSSGSPPLPFRAPGTVTCSPSCVYFGVMRVELICLGSTLYMILDAQNREFNGFLYTACHFHYCHGKAVQNLLELNL